MEPLTIALVVLVVVGVWAVIELALFLRRSRKSVAELTDTVNDTLGEVRPVIAKLDGAADELVPASKRIEPILEKAATSVDLVNVDLVRLEGILSDVNSVTDTGARVSGAVTGAAESVASGVASAVGKVAGKVAGPKRQQKIASNEAPHLEAAAPASPTAPPDGQDPRVEHARGDAGYFTYPDADAAKQDVRSQDATDAAKQDARPEGDALPQGEAAAATAAPVSAADAPDTDKQ